MSHAPKFWPLVIVIVVFENAIPLDFESIAVMVTFCLCHPVIVNELTYLDA